MMPVEWYKPRNYLHFDLPIGRDKAKKLVSNPKHVASHSFLPFISYKISSRKIYKDNGQIKYKEKERPIAFAAHADSHIYAYYKTLLDEKYESALASQQFGDSILAFRALGKSNIDFAKQAFQTIKDMGECSVIGLDISGFFDNLDHKILKKNWARLLNSTGLPDDHYSVFKSITKFSIVDRVKLYKHLGISQNNPQVKNRRVCSIEDFRTRVRAGGLIEKNLLSKGIPQGSPISAFLSNVYMYEFDRVVYDAVEEQGGKYFRYCDDMLFIVPQEWRDKIAGFARIEIKKLKIDINPKKTEIRDFNYQNGALRSDKPLQYLGFLFDGNQVLLRSSSLARYSERMRRGVRFAKKTAKRANKIRARKGEPIKPLYKKKLYERYSHLGRRNFVRYGLRAADGLNSRAIKKQLKPLWKRLKEQIEKE